MLLRPLACVVVGLGLAVEDVVLGHAQELVELLLDALELVAAVHHVQRLLGQVLLDELVVANHAIAMPDRVEHRLPRLMRVDRLALQVRVRVGRLAVHVHRYLVVADVLLHVQEVVDLVADLGLDLELDARRHAVQLVEQCLHLELDVGHRSADLHVAVVAETPVLEQVDLELAALLHEQPVEPHHGNVGVARHEARAHGAAVVHVVDVAVELGVAVLEHQLAARYHHVHLVRLHAHLEQLLFHVAQPELVRDGRVHVLDVQVDRVHVGEVVDRRVEVAQARHVLLCVLDDVLEVVGVGLELALQELVEVLHGPLAGRDHADRLRLWHR